jgi:hypothetical protein
MWYQIHRQRCESVQDPEEVDTFGFGKKPNDHSSKFRGSRQSENTGFVREWFAPMVPPSFGQELPSSRRSGEQQQNCILDNCDDSRFQQFEKTGFEKQPIHLRLFFFLEQQEAYEVDRQPVRLLRLSGLHHKSNSQRIHRAEPSLPTLDSRGTSSHPISVFNRHSLLDLPLPVAPAILVVLDSPLFEQKSQNQKQQQRQRLH